MHTTPRQYSRSKPLERQLSPVSKPLRYPKRVPVIECARCGYEWTVASIRKAENFCTSCRAKPVKTVGKNEDKCIPWRGRFDVDLVTPIDDNGVQVKPGPRTCGHRDCMNNKHRKVK